MKKNTKLKPVFYVLFTFSLMFEMLPLFAQDIIHMKDGTEIKARIETVTSSEIQFQKYAELDLDLYYVNTSDVLRINYENGDVKNFDNNAAIRKVTQEHQIGSINDVDQQLFLKHSYWNGGFNMVDANGRKIKKRLKKREMYGYLEGNSEALEYYQKYRRNMKINNIFAYSGLGIAMAGVVLWTVGTIDGAGYYNETSTLVDVGTTCFFGGLILGAAVGIPTKILVHSYGYKTASSYNNKYLSTRKVDLNFGLGRNGIGLTLGF